MLKDKLICIIKWILIKLAPLTKNEYPFSLCPSWPAQVIIEIISPSHRTYLALSFLFLFYICCCMPSDIQNSSFFYLLLFLNAFYPKHTVRVYSIIYPILESSSYFPLRILILKCKNLRAVGKITMGLLRSSVPRLNFLDVILKFKIS